MTGYGGAMGPVIMVAIDGIDGLIEQAQRVDQPRGGFSGVAYVVTGEDDPARVKPPHERDGVGEPFAGKVPAQMNVRKLDKAHAVQRRGQPWDGESQFGDVEPTRFDHTAIPNCTARCEGGSRKELEKTAAAEAPCRDPSRH